MRYTLSYPMSREITTEKHTGVQRGWHRRPEVRMMRPGDDVALERMGGKWVLNRVLGEGSQGRVFEIESVSRPGQKLALKWYSQTQYADHQLRCLRKLVERGAPSANFIWPIELIMGDSGDFGYTMELMPERAVGLSTVMRGQLDISPSLAVRIALNLAHSFLLLHSEGLCYRDISFGNVLLDPHTSEVLICDNDNVGVDGESVSVVLGTRRFMAPEIVRGEARPSTETDLHSLAVLIFYILMVHHPLIGRRELEYPCLNEVSEHDLFGRSPLFIFDPVNDGNAPDPYEHAGVLANWNLHPAPIRRLFLAAFTEGLHDPSKRVRESVWRAELAALLDSVSACGECGAENFISEQAPTCWLCGVKAEVPPSLQFGNRKVLLGSHARIYRHHLARNYDFSEAVGEVVKHPSLDRWGLTNLSTDSWRAQVPGRPDLRLSPGQTLTLVADTVIHFSSEAHATIIS